MIRRAAATPHMHALAPKPAPRTRRGGNRNVLFVVAVLLASSGIIRIGDGVNRAMAEQATEGATVVADVEGAPTESGPPESTTALIAALKAREEKIAEQERLMADRESAIGIANAKIDARLAELTRAEEQLSKTVTIADTAAEEDIGKLVSVYESMKPKDAAPLFQEMAPEFAAGFLSRMRSDAAAAVMATIDPKQAYMISVVLAGRNANAPAD